MNIESLYTTALYEVLGENTQKYTSTTVSGGGGAVAGNSSLVYGQSAPVTSTTHYHSDQDIWVRNLESGRERKFSFTSFNIDVRPGHKLLCAWNNDSEKLERVINITTGRTYAANGKYNDWTGIGKTFRDSPGSSFWASLLRFSIWPAIPFLSALHALGAFFIYFLKGAGPYWREPAEDIRKYGTMLLILDAILLIWATSLGNDRWVQMGDWFIYMLVAMVSFTVLHKKIIDTEFKVVKAHIDALDNYLAGFIRSKQTVWDK